MRLGRAELSTISRGFCDNDWQRNARLMALMHVVGAGLQLDDLASFSLSSGVMRLFICC